MKFWAIIRPWCLAMVLVLLALCPQISAQSEVGGFFGKAVSVEGEVYLTRGMLEIELTSTEEEFKLYDLVETGPTGKLIISFASSYISIGPNSSFEITRRKAGQTKITSIFLEAGSIRSKVVSLKKDEGFEIQTPVAVAGVRGTDFVIRYNENRKVPFSSQVISGRVEIRSLKATRRTMPSVVEDMEAQAINRFGKLMKKLIMNDSSIEKIKMELPIPGDSGDQNVNDDASKTGGEEGSATMGEDIDINDTPDDTVNLGEEADLLDLNEVEVEELVASLQENFEPEVGVPEELQDPSDPKNNLDGINSVEDSVLSDSDVGGGGGGGGSNESYGFDLIIDAEIEVD